jgi:hypothetical protein
LQYKGGEARYFLTNDWEWVESFSYCTVIRVDI